MRFSVFQLTKFMNIAAGKIQL